LICDWSEGIAALQPTQRKEAAMRSRFALGCLILAAVVLGALAARQELHRPEITDPSLVALPIPNLDAPVFVGRAEEGGFFSGEILFRPEDSPFRPTDLTAWGAGYAPCGVLLSGDCLPEKEEGRTLLQRARPVIDGWLRPAWNLVLPEDSWLQPTRNPLSEQCHSGGGFLDTSLDPLSEELRQANHLDECFDPDPPPRLSIE
jgi:hypothetical protein